MSPGSTPGLTGIDSSAALQARFLGVQQLLTGISLVPAASTVTQQAIRKSQILATALKNIPAIHTPFPANNGLAEHGAAIPRLYRPSRSPRKDVRDQKEFEREEKDGLLRLE